MEHSLLNFSPQINSERVKEALSGPHANSRRFGSGTVLPSQVEIGIDAAQSGPLVNKTAKLTHDLVQKPGSCSAVAQTDVRFSQRT